MDDCWFQLLSQFFESHSKGLGEVLDAEGCREGWLHGELFRYFRFHRGFESFKVNSLKIGEGKKADFSSEHPSKVVGEIKLLGSEYGTKCITGGAIKPFLERINLSITVADKNILCGRWGLIRDFFRLHDFAVREKRGAYLVLIVDKRHEKKSDLSMTKALREINFIGPSKDLPFPAGVIRIWPVSTILH